MIIATWALVFATVLVLGYYIIRYIKLRVPVLSIDFTFEINEELTDIRDSLQLRNLYVELSNIGERSIVIKRVEVEFFVDELSNITINMDEHVLKPDHSIINDLDGTEIVDKAMQGEMVYPIRGKITVSTHIKSFFEEFEIDGDAVRSYLGEKDRS